jgi:hypothetical protein
MIRLGTFSPTLRVIFSRSRSMKGRPSYFLFEIVLIFTLLLLPFYFLPFTLRYFTPHRISMSDAIRNSLSCLQPQQVGIRLNPFRDSCM